jgi:hypothetical protein
LLYLYGKTNDINIVNYAKSIVYLKNAYRYCKAEIEYSKISEVISVKSKLTKELSVFAITILNKMTDAYKYEIQDSNNLELITEVMHVIDEGITLFGNAPELINNKKYFLVKTKQYDQIDAWIIKLIEANLCYSDWVMKDKEVVEHISEKTKVLVKEKHIQFENILREWNDRKKMLLSYTLDIKSLVFCANRISSLRFKNDIGTIENYEWQIVNIDNSVLIGEITDVQSIKIPYEIEKVKITISEFLRKVPISELINSEASSKLIRDIIQEKRNKIAERKEQEKIQNARIIKAFKWFVIILSTPVVMFFCAIFASGMFPGSSIVGRLMVSLPNSLAPMVFTRYDIDVAQFNAENGKDDLKIHVDTRKPNKIIDDADIAIAFNDLLNDNLETNQLWLGLTEQQKSKFEKNPEIKKIIGKLEKNALITKVTVGDTQELNKRLTILIIRKVYPKTLKLSESTK